MPVAVNYDRRRSNNDDVYFWKYGVLTFGITLVILMTMKTAISLPDPIFESADQLARRLDISRSELYVRALKSYIEAHRDDGVTDTLNHVYATENASLDPIVAQLQSVSLPGDEW